MLDRPCNGLQHRSIMEHTPNTFELSQPVSNLPARRIRYDGWTAARQEAFLKALAACGCVTDACRAVGMSRESAYQLYNRPASAAFRRAWDAALDCAGSLVEDGAWERSIKGVARPIFYKGEQVGEYRHFDERLTMFLLRYRRAHRYGSQLDRLPPSPPPVQPPGWDSEQPNPDEAIGTLDWHLGDLVDEAGLPGGPGEASRACGGVNFVNFVGISGAGTSGGRFEHEMSAETSGGHFEHGMGAEASCAHEHDRNPVKSSRPS